MMNFGNKIKELRLKNHLSQEELAEKIYVTRTAVSKWENDRGLPNLESLKCLSNLFEVSIDDLISEEDIEKDKEIDKKKSRTFYIGAIFCLFITMIFSLLVHYLQNKYLQIPCILGMFGYIILAMMSKGKYEKNVGKKILLSYFISRIVVLLILIGFVVYTLLTLS